MTFYYVLGVYAVVFIVTTITLAIVYDDKDYLAYIAVGCFWPLLALGFAIVGLCILAQKTERVIKRFTSKESP